MSSKRKKIYLSLEQRVAAEKMLDQGRTAQFVADSAKNRELFKANY